MNEEKAHELMVRLCDEPCLDLANLTSLEGAMSVTDIMFNVLKDDQWTWPNLQKHVTAARAIGYAEIDHPKVGSKAQENWLRCALIICRALGYLQNCHDEGMNLSRYITLTGTQKTKLYSFRPYDFYAYIWMCLNMGDEVSFQKQPPPQTYECESGWCAYRAQLILDDVVKTWEKGDPLDNISVLRTWLRFGTLRATDNLRDAVETGDAIIDSDENSSPRDPADVDDSCATIPGLGKPQDLVGFIQSTVPENVETTLGKRRRGNEDAADPAEPPLKRQSLGYALGPTEVYITRMTEDLDSWISNYVWDSKGRWTKDDTCVIRASFDVRNITEIEVCIRKYGICMTLGRSQGGALFKLKLPEDQAIMITGVEVDGMIRNPNRWFTAFIISQ